MGNKIVPVRFLLLLIVCTLLCGCSSPVKHEDAQAFHTINTWKGQNIQFAIDILGPPDKVATGPKGHFYFWYNSREVNTQLTSNNLTVVEGHEVLQNPNASSYNHNVSCRIRLETNTDNVILDYRFGGNTLACQKLAEKVNDADEKSGSESKATGGGKAPLARGWE